MSERKTVLWNEDVSKLSPREREWLDRQHQAIEPMLVVGSEVAAFAGGMPLTGRVVVMGEA